MYILSQLLLIWMAAITTTTTCIKMPYIKHLVLSGGGAAGFSYYGVLKQTQLRGLWYSENIKTIYATSVGTFLAVIVSLGYDWKTIDDYLIKRPWQNVYKFELSMAIKIVLNQGIFDQTNVYETFKPLFKGKDIPIDINLLDFYKRTQKEIHFFTTDFRTFDTIDISYKTHPEWKVMDAIYASSSLPIMFIPFYRIELEEEPNIYIDGGIKMNYPLNKCLDDGNNPEEILGITRLDLDPPVDKKLYRTNNLFEFILKMIYKYAIQIEYPLYTTNISHQIGVSFSALDFSSLFKCVANSEERAQLIHKGVCIANRYVDEYLKKMSPPDSDDVDTIVEENEI